MLENEELKKEEYTDDELIEEVKSEDDAPVQVIYRCKKCGQILAPGAKDCWKCSSKDIEEVVEEDTKELKKVMIQARLDKVEAELKSVKKNNDFLYLLVAAVVIVAVIYILSNR